MDACKISDFEAFADAAEEFHPHISFFATFNAKVSNNDYYLKFDQTHLIWLGTTQMSVWKYTYVLT